MQEGNGDSCRVLIMCAGKQRRWGRVGQVRKHLVEIGGEAILYRTVRLCRDFQRLHGITMEIGVVAFDGDDGYRVCGTSLLVPETHTMLSDDQEIPPWPFTSSKWWNAYGRTVILLGDVFFSESALRTILSPRAEWSYFGRFGGSKTTGCRWGELFGLAFLNDHHDLMLATICQVMATHAAGCIKKASGWEHYQCLVGAPLIGRTKVDHFVEIDDWTEDFDFPQDLSEWLARYAEQHEHAVSRPTGT